MSKKIGHNKQILYVNLFPRVMSTFIDLMIALLLLPIPTDWLRIEYFAYRYGELFAKHGVDPRNIEASLAFLSKPEISQYFSFSDFLELVTIVPMMTAVLPLFIYFISSWYYFGTTPAKYFFSMKIVDENTLEKPKLINLIWRFFGYGFFFIGVWFIFFTEKKQTFHDKLGKTIVISA